jgi:hypothetical protein
MQSVLSINHQVAMGQQERHGALNITLERVLNRVFGCWQHDLGRPFSNNGRTYRICTKCGMSRDFDTTSWTMKGHYHVTATSKIVYSKSNALRRVHTDQKRSSHTTWMSPSLSQPVTSIGSVKQGQFGTDCNAGIAA